MALVYGLTMGSTGGSGRGFFADLQQADTSSLFAAFLGGVIFNLSNLLLVAAIAVAGLSVAFPVGVGLALVIGVFVNYINKPEGDPILLFGGVALVVIAIVVNAIASAKVSAAGFSDPLLNCKSCQRNMVHSCSSCPNEPRQHARNLKRSLRRLKVSLA